MHQAERTNLSFYQTVSSDPYPYMSGQSTHGYLYSNGRASTPASPMSFTSGDAPATPKPRGRPKAPPKPTIPHRPVPILPAPGPNSTVPSQHAPIRSSQSSQAPSSLYFLGPTNLPPVSYGTGSGMQGAQGQGTNIQSQHSRLSDRQSQRLPELEARLDRLEDAVGRYVDQRGERALERSYLPRN